MRYLRNSNNEIHEWISKRDLYYYKALSKSISIGFDDRGVQGETPGEFVGEELQQRQGWPKSSLRGGWYPKKSLRSAT